MNTNDFALTILFGIKKFLAWIGIPSHMLDKMDELLFLIVIVIIAFIVAGIVHAVLVHLAKKILKRKRVGFFESMFKYGVFRKLTAIIPPLMVSALLPFAFSKDSAWFILSEKITWIYFFIALIISVNAILNTVGDELKKNKQLKNRPMKGFIQIFRVVFYCVVVIVIISILINKSPLNLITGLGAFTAVLMLVFKDTILGLVAGVMISEDDMLRIGDWIEMPSQNADGDVIEIALHTVKVRNWDNTITTIPPYLLVSDSFQNWRGMRESGGRRVKRSINIDMTSVRFCTPEMLAKYRKIQLLKDYVEQTEEVIEKYNVENGIDNSILVNGRRQTNLGVFRAYLTAYLKSLPDVNQELTCMVRQLQPTDRGIPIELYFFCALKDWVPYEGVQADVFDHVLAIIPEFDLQVFQSPSGRDFQRVLPAASEEKGA